VHVVMTISHSKVSLTQLVLFRPQEQSFAEEADRDRYCVAVALSFVLI